MRQIRRAPRLRAYATATAAAALGALAFTGTASATVYNATNDATFESALASANTAGGTNTINVATGNYAPAATLNVTNGQTLTIQGPTQDSSLQVQAAKFNGGAIQPTGSTIFSVASGVTVTFRNIQIATAGSATHAIIDDLGTVTVDQSTVNGKGPALRVGNGATGFITNSTMGDGLGLGIVDNGTLTMKNSTVTRNPNGGIDNASGTLNLINTIIAQNGNKDCTAAATTSDHSLDGDGTCGLDATPAKANLSSKDALLGPLQGIGGSTSADFPALGSPEIDAGNPAVCPATDQRGATRADSTLQTPSVASGCDIGAVETYYDTPPVLTTPNQTVSSPSASGTVANYTVTWKAGSPVTGASCSPASGSVFPVGATTVTCSGGTDTAFGTATGSQTFTVTDTQPTAPVVTTSGSKTVAAVDATGAIATFTASATGAGGSVPTTCTPASGSKFPLGPTTVTCTATDANGTGTATLVIAVTDQTKPVITVPSNMTVQQSPVGGTSTNILYTVTATDNVDASVTPTCVPASGTAFAVGTTTTVTCNATDAAGNAATAATFTITVNAVTPDHTNATVFGTVGATGALQITAGTCDLGTLIPAQTNTYLCTDPLTVSSSDTTAFLTINDVSAATTTGHLVNSAYSLATGLKAKATSTATGTTSSGFGFVPGPAPTAPYQLLSWNAPVTNDAVTLTGQQAIAASEVLHNGTYAATVLLQLGGTP